MAYKEFTYEAMEVNQCFFSGPGIASEKSLGYWTPIYKAWEHAIPYRLSGLLVLIILWTGNLVECRTIVSP